MEILDHRKWLLGGLIKLEYETGVLMDFIQTKFIKDQTRADMLLELHDIKARLARLQRLTDQLK